MWTQLVRAPSPPASRATLPLLAGLGETFIVASNPDEASALPYLLRLPLERGRAGGVESRLTLSVGRERQPRARRLCHDPDMAVMVTHYSDPGCPWAYSVSPALAVLRWRYRDQLDWRLVTIGLTEHSEQYAARGYTPSRTARAYRTFRRYGMPFTTEPRARVAATGRACRAIVATRLREPEREDEAFRALQLAWFTTNLVLDKDRDIARALEQIPDLDVEATVSAIDDPYVSATYEADRAEARTAAGSPTELQGKAANTDGAARYTAPSLVFEVDGRRLEAGGFQPVEAYDVLIANLDPGLDRAAPAEDPLAVLERFPRGLVTQEIAAVMAAGNDPPNRARTEEALIDLAAAGHVKHVSLADDALWVAAEAARSIAEPDGIGSSLAL